MSLTLFFSIALLAGCQNSHKPSGLLDETEMVSVMTDIHLVDGYVSTLNISDTVKVSKRDLYQSVFKKHQITDSIYENSLKYYSRQPELLDTLYVQVEKKLNDTETRLNRIQAMPVKKAPTVE